MRALNGMLTPEKEINGVLTPSEKVEYVFKMPLEHFVFTNKRLMFFDFAEQVTINHGCHSVPYQNISHFSMEPFDEGMLKYKLKIWLSGSTENIEKIVDVDSEFEKVHKVLADFVLNKNPMIIDTKMFIKNTKKGSIARTFGIGGLMLGSLMGAKYFNKMLFGKQKKIPAALMKRCLKHTEKKQEHSKQQKSK